MKTKEILALAKKAGGWVNISSTESKIRLRKDLTLLVIYTAGYGSTCTVQTPVGSETHQKITKDTLSDILGVPKPEPKKVPVPAAPEAPKEKKAVSKPKTSPGTSGTKKKAVKKPAAKKKAAPKKTTKK